MGALERGDVCCLSGDILESLPPVGVSRTETVFEYIFRRVAEWRRQCFMLELKVMTLCIRDAFREN